MFYANLNMDTSDALGTSEQFMLTGTRFFKIQYAHKLLSPETLGSPLEGKVGQNFCLAGSFISVFRGGRIQEAAVPTGLTRTSSSGSAR